MGQQLVLPTAAHQEWANCEIGVIIHFDMPTFVPGYNWQQDPPPPATIFAPQQLDTDQWISAAASAGARYAVLVAKHCSGFCLWPTQAHPYSIAASPWKNGQGDVVADFIASCKKYGVKPGLYYSAQANGYLGITAEGLRAADQAQKDAYSAVVLQQLRELWSNYGPLFEIWFDGGVLPVEEGGPDIAALLHELQPQAVVFQGPPGTKSLIRWVGNESGIAPQDCSAIVDYQQQSFDGTQAQANAGNTFGNLWCPAEADMPNRSEHFAYQGGWFYKSGEEQFIYPPQELLERYLSSVGRNTNLLLGMVIDNTGQFPQADSAAFADFGELLQKHFAQPLCAVQPAPGQTEFVFQLPKTQPARYLLLQEDIACGERTTAYTVEYTQQGETRVLHTGSIIGHKRILALAQLSGGSLRVQIQKSKAAPVLLTAAVY